MVGFLVLTHIAHECPITRIIYVHLKLLVTFIFIFFKLIKCDILYFLVFKRQFSLKQEDSLFCLIRVGRLRSLLYSEGHVTQPG